MSEIARFIRRTKEKVGRAHDGTFIGAVDWSMNESKQNRYQPFWCQHVHGFTVTNAGETKVKKALKKQFPPSPPTHPRPVKVEEWDGRRAALRYPMKNKYERRISTKGKRFNKKTGKMRKCRSTDHQPLRSKDKLELFLHLDEIGIGGRLLLKNVQFLNLKPDGPTFVDRSSKT